MKTNGSEVGGVGSGLGSGERAAGLEAEIRKLRDELARVTRQGEILKMIVGKNRGSVTSRYEQIKALSAEFSVNELCETLEVSRSGYYRWMHRAPSKRAVANTALVQEIKRIFWKHRRRYGSPRITAALRRLGHRCNPKRVARLMREHGLRGRPRRSRQPRTTNSNHSGPIAPNLLEGKGFPTAVDQIWVADITYLPTREGWVYLAAVMDLYSRRILGWSLQATLGSKLPLEALERALARRGEASGVIHHSDRGCQYASQRYREALEEREFCRSMSRRGHGYDNSAIESFWSTLKGEMRVDGDGLPRTEVGLRVCDYIEAYYNDKRLHSALEYRSPVEFEDEPELGIKISGWWSFL